ncbi:unnamed protein product [Arabis nemorensis]|uniref:MATH domain-containing protein n=1 Tax=Arabis nemorensis TaxID=586526 RepID=A0A565BSF1_9BRAS|nr:unnamed protein product [Arabis nemorensis]
MFQDEKRKTNYGAMCLFLKLGTTSSISVIDSPISSGELSDRREFKRKQEPSTYCLKIANFVKFANSPNNLRYECRPFASGGFNWTLIVYPKGNKNEDGQGQLSIGVDIFVTEHFKQWEAFRFTDHFHKRFYTWTISKFSSLDKEFYVTDKFEIGGRNCGDGDGQGKSVSLYLAPADVISYDRIYLRAKLRILNQKDSKHFEKSVEGLSDRTNSWGFQKFVPFSDLKNSSTGLLVNDTLKVEVEVEDLSKTKYFPE